MEMNTIRKYGITVIAAITLMTYGCADGSDSKLASESTQATEELTDHTNDAEEGLKLNNGEKWRVNDEMMVHIRRMETDLSHFESMEIKDYTLLASMLKNNVSLLTSSCTMTGDSHDELHKWLLPHIVLIEDLRKSENTDNREAVYEEILLSLETLNTYFE